MKLRRRVLQWKVPTEINDRLCKVSGQRAYVSSHCAQYGAAILNWWFGCIHYIKVGLIFENEVLNSRHIEI